MVCQIKLSIQQDGRKVTHLYQHSQNVIAVKPSNTPTGNVIKLLPLRYLRVGNHGRQRRGYHGALDRQQRNLEGRHLLTNSSMYLALSPAQYESSCWSYYVECL